MNKIKQIVVTATITYFSGLGSYTTLTWEGYNTYIALLCAIIVILSVPVLSWHNDKDLSFLNADNYDKPKRVRE